MIIRLDGSLGNVIREAGNYYDSGTYPNLDRKAEWLPFGYIICKYDDIRADQSAKRHRYNEKQEPRNYFCFIGNGFRLIRVVFRIIRRSAAARRSATFIPAAPASVVSAGASFGTTTGRV